MDLKEIHSSPFYHGKISRKEALKLINKEAKKHKKEIGFYLIRKDHGNLRLLFKKIIKYHDNPNLQTSLFQEFILRTDYEFSLTKFGEFLDSELEIPKNSIPIKRNITKPLSLQKMTKLILASFNQYNETMLPKTVNEEIKIMKKLIGEPWKK